jgi:23S rRNA pseudouridine2605 synthase
MKAVGRLDYTSEGLLLITNDGVLKRYLELPEHAFARRYEVETRGKLNTKWLDYLGKGATVGDFTYKPIIIDVTRELTKKRHTMEITLTEGKTREIRKALEAGGMSVKRLKRVGYGPYHLGGLARGDLLEIKAHRKHLVKSGILVEE